jgi:uncharacterized protein (TIGR03000 family)
MRKTFLILGLVVLALSLSADDVLAQRGRGGRGGYYGRGGGYYGRGYYGRGGFYGGYYGLPLYGGYSYGGGYYPYYSGSGYYDVGPNYNYSAQAMQAPSTDVRQSLYSDPNVATLTVMVPNGDAKVWFDDVLTSQNGTQRVFLTPPLSNPGSYTIKARWNSSSGPINGERQVRVQPGQSVMVDFRSEPVSSPQSSKQ